MRRPVNGKRREKRSGGWVAGSEQMNSDGRNASGGRGADWCCFAVDCTLLTIEAAVEAVVEVVMVIGDGWTVSVGWLAIQSPLSLRGFVYWQGLMGALRRKPVLIRPSESAPRG